MPVQPRDKRPFDFAARRLRDGWAKLRVAEAEIDVLFPPEANVGVLLGEPSGGLLDVDKDCDEVRRAAPHLLPATGMVGGRASAPDSHSFFVVRDPPATASEKFRDPLVAGAGANLLLELRSTGAQTLVAPSTYGAEPDRGHPEAERFVWSKRDEPAAVDVVVLRTAVAAVAAAALLGRYWPRSSRHDAALALAGGLRRAGWLEESAVRFVEAVCAAAGDDEVSNRVGCVRDTFAKGDDEKLSGWPSLAKLFGSGGDAIVNAVTGWLKVPAATRQVKRATDPGPQPGRKERYVPVPEYVPFPTDVLPPPWDTFVREGAAALRCDEALVALPLLAVLAAAIGNTRRLHLGAEWYESAVLWTCVVAESGSLKSPAAELSTDLVQARQKALVKDFKEQVTRYKAEMRDFKNADGDSRGDAPEEPVLKRVLASDVTIEKLVTLLDDNPRGMLVYRDELSGWVNSFSRYKGGAGGSDESNWLSMHRAGPVIYDRKTGTKTTVFVPNAAVSVTGGVQPGTLRRLMTPNFFESGLVARILFAMPPRAPKRWTDARIGDATREAAVRSLDALFNLAPERDADGDTRPVVVRLGPDSQSRMKEFVNRWGALHFESEGARASALAKLEALPGRFALIHHTVMKAGAFEDTDPVGVESVGAGVRLAEWAAREADRVYAMLGESDANREVGQLVERVRRVAGKEGNGGRVTVNQLQRSYQRKYKTADLARADLDRLVELELGDWGPSPPKPTGGWRPDYFTLRTTPRVMDDTSYPRPPAADAGEGRPDDSRSTEPHNGPTPKPRIYDPTPNLAETWDEGSAAGEGRVYEVSSIVPAGSEIEQAQTEEGTDAGERHPVFSLLDTSEGVRITADALRRWAGPVAVDTETTGLDPARDRVRLIQIAAGEDVALIDVFALPDPVADLRPLFEALASKEVVGHNLQFDLRFLAPLGFVPGKVFDTMLASRVLHAGDRAENNGRFRHGLADVAARELGRALDKREQTSDWSGPLSPAQLGYAAADAEVLLPLASALRDKLEAAGLTGTAELEMRALPGVAWAAPVAVDTRAWGALAEGAEADRARLADAMDAAAPNPSALPGMETRNWDSPAQVKAAFAQLGFALAATDDGTLAGVGHPLGGLVREYRAAAKRLGTYGRVWVTKHVRNGAVLPSWNQLGAESGRMSCSDPNLQQVPRGSAYRRCFTARPGHLLVKADYSQIELRIAARVAHEKVMMAAYVAGRDLHTLTAARVLNKDEGAVTKDDRQLAKAVNFGLLYGMGWKGLQRYAQANYGVELSDVEARAYRAAFFAAYPGLRAWHARVEGHVKKLFATDPGGTHEVRTLGGRRRVLPVAKKGADGSAYPNKADALNGPVQGAGADGLKAAVALLWERRAECPGAVPVLFCHDEIVLEVPEPGADRARRWLRGCMVDAVAPLIAPVPVEVEVTVGRTWGG